MLLSDRAQPSLRRRSDATLDARVGSHVANRLTQAAARLSRKPLQPAQFRTLQAASSSRGGGAGGVPLCRCSSYSCVVFGLAAVPRPRVSYWVLLDVLEPGGPTIDPPKRRSRAGRAPPC